ncbi:MAG: Hsp20/alpha crystallin family protein [bacterium]|nr:Hsp20/alpha crystallin family protein [bacterium]
MSLSPFGKDIPTSLGDLQGEMNRVFDRFWHGGWSAGPFDGNAWAPIVDMFEEEDRVVVMAEVPGVDADGIELNFQEGRLTIKGERSTPWPEGSSGRLARRERRYGLFSRTIELPAEVDPEKITAAVSCGVMEVTLPKIVEQRGRTIKVESGD